MKKECLECGREFEVPRRHPYKIFCSPHCATYVTNRHRHVERLSLIEAHLRASGCAWCGINDVRVLVFHHRDPCEKDFDIGDGLRGSLATLRQEMDKCTVLCQNCHAILHWEARRPSFEEKVEKDRLIEQRRMYSYPQSTTIDCG